MLKRKNLTKVRFFLIEFKRLKLNEERNDSDYSEFMLLENKEFTIIFSVCRAQESAALACRRFLDEDVVAKPALFETKENTLK